MKEKTEKQIQEEFEKQIKGNLDYIERETKKLVDKAPLKKKEKEMVVKNVKNIMKNTCFSGLSWCCCKPCPYRNKALEQLGITEKELIEMKREFDRRLILKALSK